jgi:hypothetical protein
VPMGDSSDVDIALRPYFCLVSSSPGSCWLRSRLYIDAGTAAQSADEAVIFCPGTFPPIRHGAARVRVLTRPQLLTRV